MLGVIVDDDEEQMGVLEKSHVDAIYKADLRAVYQFIRTDEGSSIELYT